MPVFVALPEEEAEAAAAFVRTRSRLHRLRVHQAFAEHSLGLAEAIEEELDRNDPEHLELLSNLSGMKEHEFMRALHGANMNPFVESRIVALGARLGISVAP